MRAGSPDTARGRPPGIPNDVATDARRLHEPSAEEAGRGMAEVPVYPGDRQSRPAWRPLGIEPGLSTTGALSLKVESPGRTGMPWGRLAPGRCAPDTSAVSEAEQDRSSKASARKLGRHSCACRAVRGLPRR